MEVNTDKSRDETELTLLDAEESEAFAENQYSFQLTIVGTKEENANILIIPT